MTMWDYCFSWGVKVCWVAYVCCMLKDAEGMLFLDVH